MSKNTIFFETPISFVFPIFSRSRRYARNYSCCCTYNYETECISLYWDGWILTYYYLNARRNAFIDQAIVSWHDVIAFTWVEPTLKS